MAITAAKLLVQVDAENSKAISALGQVENKLRQMAGTGQGVGQIFAGVFGANLAASAISGFKNLAAEGLQAYTSYERLGMSLQSLTAKELMNAGAAKTMTQAYALAGPKAKELLDWTQKLAIQSPFTQDDVAQAFRMAQAYGFTTDEAQRLTTALIDFSAGTGATGETMQRVALALGQIQAKGKLAGQEVLQLVNAGVSVDAILADAFGKSTAEIVAMREQGLIPADQAIQAIVETLERDFGGAAARQTETFAGLISSLEDIKKVGLREFFESTFEAIRPVVQEFVDSFNSGELLTNLREAGKDFGEFVGDLIGRIREVINWWKGLDEGTQKVLVTLAGFAVIGKPVIGTLADIVWAIKAVGVAMATFSGPVGLMITGIGLIGIAIGEVISDLEDFKIEQQRVTEGAEQLTGQDWQTLYHKAFGMPHDATKTWQDYGDQVQKTSEQQKKAKDTAGDLAAEMNKLKQAAQNAALQAGLSGTLTKSMEEYKQTLADLAPEHEQLAARLQFLNVDGWIPSAESVGTLAEKLREKNGVLSEAAALEQAEIILLASHRQQLDEVQAALGDNEAAQQAAAAAMAQATAEMIYQQAAAGLDAEASLQLARAMGMISEQDYALSTSLAALRLQYDSNADGAISAGEGAKQYASDVALMYQAVSDLQAADLPLTVDNIRTAMEELSTVDVNLSENLPDGVALEEAGKGFDSIKVSAITAFDEISTDASTTVTEVQGAFTSVDWAGTGTQIGTDLSSGVKGSSFKTDMAALRDAIKLMWTTEASWPGVGRFIMEGITQGVRNNKGILEDAVRAAIAAALAAARDEADMGSPSKLFAEMVGKPISQGIALGMLQAAPVTAQAAQTVVRSTAETVYQQPINIYPTITREIDYYEMAMTVAGILAG